MQNRKFVPIRLARDNDVDLEFDGVVVAGASTRRPSAQDRWSDFAIFLTSTGKWVFQVIGKSALQGEVDLSHAFIANTPQELVNSLFKPDDGGGYYLSRPGKDLLRILETEFPEIVEFREVEKI